MRPLDRQHVVVTGSSSGIGRAIAVAAARLGANCLVHCRRNREGAESTAAMVRQQDVEAHVVSANLAEPDDRRRLTDEAFAWSPRIDAWVHNAGADVLTGPVGHQSFEDKLARLWEVDVRGTILLARHVADRMLAADSTRADADPPSMVFIGWDQADDGMDGDSGQMFGPVKAAVMAYSRSLAQSLAPRVRVNCVAPGWIRTSWGETSDPYWDRRATNDALMHRWGTPDDVAGAVMYFISPEARFITGQTLDVNGGWNRRDRLS